MDPNQPNRPPPTQLQPPGFQTGQHDIPVYGGGLQHYSQPGQPQQQQQQQQQHQQQQQPQQFVPYGLPHPPHLGGPAPFQVGPSAQQKQFGVGPIPHYGSPSPYGPPRPAPPQSQAGLPLGAHQFDPRLTANSPAHHLLNLSLPQQSLPQQQQQQPAPSAYAPRAQLPPQQHQHQHSPSLSARGERGADDDYVPEADDDDRGAAALLAQVANQHNQAQQGVAPPRRESSARSGGSRWTQEEDDKLVEAIKEDPPLNWSQIGEKLGKRSQVCGQRWYNHLSDLYPAVKRVEPNGKVPRGMIYKEAGSSDSEPEEASSPEPVEKVTRGPLRRWAGEDDESLKVAYAKHGGETEAAWQAIATDVGHNRTWRACRQRWNTHHKPAEEEEEEEEEFLVEGEGGVEGDLQVEGGEQVEGDDDFEMEDDDEVEADADWDEDSKGPAPKAKRTAASRVRPKAPGVKGKHTFTPAGQSPVFLPASALVAKPPIPFTPTSVIRGRRTLAEEELKGKLFSPSGKAKKVHTCPAENCSAAFKRSEHLKRHYRSVHMGSKPFPCQMTGCTKSFSRKDNLQQHMAMVHSQRAVKLDEPLEDGTTHRYEPIEDQPPKKRAVVGAVARRASAAKTRKAKAAKDASEDGEGAEGTGAEDAEGDAEGEGGSAAGGEGSENLDPALTAGDHAAAESTNAAAATTEGDATAAASTDATTSNTAEEQAHFNENDFLKQLQAMEATALAEAKQTDGEETSAGASSLQFVPPPPAPEGGDVQVDLEVGGGAKRAREEDGAEASQEQQKKQRVVGQEGDIAVGGEDIEVPLVEGGEEDGSYERTRV